MTTALPSDTRPRTSPAAVIAVGANNDGWREVLGMEIGTSEARADLDRVSARALLS